MRRSGGQASPAPVVANGAAREPQRRWHGIVLLAIPVAFLSAFYVAPMLHTLAAAASADAWRWVAQPSIRAGLRMGLKQAVLSTALAMLAAVPLAWMYHTRTIPGRRLHLAVHALPFVMPVFVVVYGMQAVFGRQGWIDSATGTVVQQALGPLWFVALANAYYNYGFATRLLDAALRRRSRTPEETAQTLGASPAAAFRRTNLRLLLPSLVAVALLVFVFTFGSFGVVLFLGNPLVQSIETMLYDQLHAGVANDPSRAAVLGVLQLALNVLLLGAAAYLARPRTPSEAPRLPPRASATRQAAAWILALIALTPIAAVAVASVHLNVAASGGPARPSWTLAAWQGLFDPQEATTFHVGHALALSLQYAAWTVVLSLGLTLCLAYGARAVGGTWRRVTETLASLPIATSSILLGFALALSFGYGSWLDLRGTRTEIVLAHTLVAFPFTARLLLPAIAQLDPALEDAARTLGASTASVVRRLHAPLLWPALASAAGFSAALSLADYGASRILMRTQNAGLSVWIGYLDIPYHPLAHAQAIALAVFLGAIVALTIALVERIRPRGVLP